MVKPVLFFSLAVLATPTVQAQEASEQTIEVEEIMSDGDGAKEVARDRAKDLEQEKRETRDLERQAERARAQAEERKRIAGPKIVATDAEIRSILKAKAKAIRDLERATQEMEKLDQKLKLQKEALEKAREEHDQVARELKSKRNQAEEYKEEARQAARETGRLNAENKQLERELKRAQSQMTDLKAQYQKVKVRRENAESLNRSRKRAVSDATENVEWAHKQMGTPVSAPSRPTFRTSSKDEGMY